MSQYFEAFKVLTAVIMKIFFFWDINAVYSVEDQQTFQRDISPPSSGLASLPASLMLVS
jgi:hypothetical protein